MRALVLREAEGRVRAAIETVDTAALPPGDVTVRVARSTLNYKDGMIVEGLGRLVRRYPHVPGVDFAGTVEASSHPHWKPGDQVILTGWRVGETRWGGYAERARVEGDWLVPTPAAFGPADEGARRAMAIGTAGLTAMLAIMALERHGLRPGAGEVLVTGAGGGLGGVAVALLARLGHRVVASTGRPALAPALTALGAHEIIDRAALAEPAGRPLESERWAGAIDAVGGATLARLLGQMRYRTAVAVCGLAAGAALETTVLPFLLRGVAMLGIDSVMCPLAERREAWARIAHLLPVALIDGLTVEAGLTAVPDLARDILAGRTRGRVVIDPAG